MEIFYPAYDSDPADVSIQYDVSDAIQQMKQLKEGFASLGKEVKTFTSITDTMNKKGQETKTLKGLTRELEKFVAVMKEVKGVNKVISIKFVKDQTGAKNPLKAEVLKFINELKGDLSNIGISEKGMDRVKRQLDRLRKYMIQNNIKPDAIDPAFLTKIAKGEQFADPKNSDLADKYKAIKAEIERDLKAQAERAGVEKGRRIYRKAIEEFRQLEIQKNNVEREGVERGKRIRQKGLEEFDQLEKQRRQKEKERIERGRQIYRQAIEEFRYLEAEKHRIEREGIERGRRIYQQGIEEFQRLEKEKRKKEKEGIEKGRKIRKEADDEFRFLKGQRKESSTVTGMSLAQSMQKYIESLKISDSAMSSLSSKAKAVGRYMAANNISMKEARILVSEVAKGDMTIADSRSGGLKTLLAEINKKIQQAKKAFADRELNEEGKAKRRRINESAKQDEKQYNSTRHLPFIEQMKQEMGNLDKLANVTKTNVIQKFEELHKYMQRVGISNKEAAEAVSKFKAGKGDELTGAQAGVVNRLVNIRKEINGVASQSKEVLISWQSLARIFIVQSLHRAFSLISQSLADASQEAAKFQLKISQIRTISQDAQLSTADWGSKLRDLSDAFGIDIIDVADAAYESISNQITKGADATRFLNEALILARVTASSTAVASNVLATVMNAYGTKAKSAQEISALLFQTIDFGRVKLDELDYSLATAAPLTASLGVNFEELLATISALTIKGIKFDTTATGINNIMAKLLSPSKELSQLFGEWGVSSGSAAVSLYGLTGILEKLGQELEKGGPARLGDLLPDIRGLRAGIAALTAGSLNDIKRFSNNSVEASKKYIEANKITVESLAKDFVVELNKVKNILTVDFGNKVLAFMSKLTKMFGGLGPIVKSVLTVFMDAADLLGSVADGIAAAGKSFDSIIPISKLVSTRDSISLLSKAFSSLLLGFGTAVGVGVPLIAMFAALDGSFKAAILSSTLLSVKLATVKAALMGLYATLMANPFIAFAALAAGAIAAAIVWMNKSREETAKIRENYLQDNKTNLEKELNEYDKFLDKQTELTTKANEEKIRDILQNNVKTRSELSKGLAQFEKTFDASSTNLLEKVQERIKKAQDNLSEIARDYNKRLVQQSINPESMTDMFTKISAELNNLNLEGQSSIFLNNFERARDVFKDMGSIAEKLVDDLKKSVDESAKEIKKLTFDKEKAKLEGVKSDSQRDRMIKTAISGKLSSSSEQANLGNIEQAKRIQEEAIGLADMIKKEKTKSQQKQVILDAQIALEQQNMALRSSQLEQAKLAERLSVQGRVGTENKDISVSSTASLFAAQLDALNKTEAEQIEAIKKNTEALVQSRDLLKEANAAARSSAQGVTGSARQFVKTVGTSISGLDDEKAAKIKDLLENVDKLEKMLGRSSTPQREIEKQQTAVRQAFFDVKDKVPLQDQQTEFKDIIQQFNLDLMSLDDAIRARAEAINSVPKNAPKGFGFAAGGVIGGTDIGHDSMFARVNYREMIMNRKAAETFAPILHAMNSFGNGRSAPAPVNNSNMTNNIYVTYDSNTTPQENVRTFVRQMKRELDRGAVRLS